MSASTIIDLQKSSLVTIIIYRTNIFGVIQNLHVLTIIKLIVRCAINCTNTENIKCIGSIYTYAKHYTTVPYVCELFQY